MAQYHMIYGPDWSNYILLQILLKNTMKRNYNLSYFLSRKKKNPDDLC